MKGALLKEWENGSREIDPSLREQLILEYTPLIKYIACRLAVRVPPSIEIDDLMNSGIIGLIDAIEKFDPKRSVKFRTYAEFRIKGAMLDELRSLDWVPRSLRQKIHQLEEVHVKLEQKLGRPASEDEMAGTLGIKIDEYYTIVNQASGVNLVSLMDLGYASENGKEKVLDFFVNGRREDPALQLRIKEIEEIVAGAIDELPKKQRLVVALYYYEELTMKEVGMILGITESRVSQIHTQAVIQLRGKLKQTIND